ncbi:MAG: hypothetical protein AAF484_17580, partial [Pseudomonadota bacterium]
GTSVSWLGVPSAAGGPAIGHAFGQAGAGPLRRGGLTPQVSARDMAGIGQRHTNDGGVLRARRRRALHVARGGAGLLVNGPDRPPARHPRSAGHGGAECAVQPLPRRHRLMH